MLGSSERLLRYLIEDPSLSALIEVLRNTQLVLAEVLTLILVVCFYHLAIVQTAWEIQELIHWLVKWLEHLVKAAQLSCLMLSVLSSWMK